MSRCQHTEMGSFSLRLVVFALSVVFIKCVDIEENGYRITVAISKDVSEDQGLLTELQNAFKSASKYLYTASRNYVYVKHVTILVPETWIKSADWTMSELTFKNADITVDTPNPSMGNNPYTFQPGLCGEKGRYIHLTSDFVLDNGINRDLYYGDFGRLLVHEFAHLRFGVFDEYGDRGSTLHPVYYVDENSILRPTACSHEMNGIFVDSDTEKSCTLDDDTKPFTKNCDFIIKDSINDATSSIMFKQFLEKVTSFCETDPSDPKIRHNADAPNKHNKMCNNRGTWDIIREHRDIKDSSPNNILDTTPTFQVVQRQIQKVNETEVCGRRFVFVLDLSESMKDKNRYFKLRQMADKIIRDILPVGTEVGITVFSDKARAWADMRYLKTKKDRQTLAEGLPNKDNFNGATAIGQGLLNGIKMLKENGKTAAGGRIFLITDGKQNVFPSVGSILTNVTKEEVVVHTLAYGEEADPILQQLSQQTFGQYSYFDESETSTALDGAGERLLEDINLCDGEDTDVEIDRHAVVLDSITTSHERTVLIDSTVGNNTLFVFTLSLEATTEISITSPSGKVYDEDSAEYTKDGTLNIVRFRFPETRAGEWSYKLKRSSTSSESVVGVVKSHPRTPGTSPFEIDSWLGKTSFNFEKDKEGLAVYAYVHQGLSSIINATVKVVVTGKIDGEEVKIEKPLKDDGLLPDNTENDGIYTNFVIGFKANSRYSMEVTVNSNDETVIITTGNQLSGAPVSYPNMTANIAYEVVEAFSRVTSVGAVDVQGFNASLDQLDPSRVTDLQVIISDRDNKEVTLSWTAPGDDLNEGTVTRYDIRVGRTFEDLRENFPDSYEIQSTDIKEGTDTPVPAGSQQNMTVSLPDHLNTENFVFGLLAIDDSNRTSELSNLKAITFEKIILPQPPSTNTVTTPTTTNETSIIIYAGVGVGIFVVVALIVGCLVFIKCRKQAKPPGQLVMA